MFKRLSITVVSALLIGSLLTACGGGAPAPVTFSSLPLFTGATESTNTALTSGLPETIDELKKQPNAANVEGKAYDLPAGTTFDAVAAFYKDALEKGGWTVVTSAAPSLSYTRGSQGFNITYMEGVGMWVFLVMRK